MFTLSLEHLPMIVAFVVLLLALYAKRATIRTPDIIAFALAAVLVFALLTGAFNALHLPHLAFHLL